MNPARWNISSAYLCDIDLTVLKADTKYDIANLKGRSIELDVRAKDKNGKYYNIEVQRTAAGAAPQRARYHMSLMDAETFPKSSTWTKLPETWIIFITEKDYFKTGQPLYTVDRVVRQTGKLFKDGGHIVYVNGKYRGDDAIGRLMHDFACRDYRDMQDEFIKEGVRILKETDKGRKKFMEYSDKIFNMGHKEGAREGRKKAQENTALSMLADNEPLEKILKYSRITLSALQKLCAQMGVPMPA